MAGIRRTKTSSSGVGAHISRGAGVVFAQLAVALCGTVLVGWGLASCAGLETLMTGSTGGEPLGRISWALLAGLYVGLVGVAASAGALALGWLPVFALAHVAWLLIPPTPRCCTRRWTMPCG